MSESGLNGSVEDYESYAPKGIEHIMALVVLLIQFFGPQVELLGWTADFKAAYRQVACSPTEYGDLGIAWWDPHSSQVLVGMLTALAFGARRSSSNWG